MRTYGLTMIPTSDSIVPVLLPLYTAESQNSLERGSRPYSVVEILREVFKEDFQKAIQSYMEKCPEGAGKGACHLAEYVTKYRKSFPNSGRSYNKL